MRNPLKFVIKLFIHLCFFVSLAFASIVWKPLSVHFPDLPAISAFSVADVNGSSICGALHEADPLNGCSPLSNAVVASNETNKTNFVLMIRGQCNFSYKIQNAQAAGYDAAIVYAHRKKSPLIYMTYPEGANVPAFYVTLETGAYLKEHARGEAGECCIFPLSYAWNKHVEKIIVWGMLLLFVISIPLLFGFARKLYPIDSPRRHRPEQTRQLPRSTVNALPSSVFSSVTSVRCHGRETLCSICLEDYREGENLRVLPCRHEFHSSCVDSWLIRWGTFCPVCRHEIRRSTSNEGNEQAQRRVLYCLTIFVSVWVCSGGLHQCGENEANMIIKAFPVMIQRYEAQQVYNPSCQNFLVITLNTITGQVILHLHHVVPLIFCHFDIMFLRLNLSSSILLNWFLVVLNDLHSLMFQWNCSFEDIDKKHCWLTMAI